MTGAVDALPEATGSAPAAVEAELTGDDVPGAAAGAGAGAMGPAMKGRGDEAPGTTVPLGFRPLFAPVAGALDLPRPAGVGVDGWLWF